jgi:uncharacterized protein
MRWLSILTWVLSCFISKEIPSMETKLKKLREICQGLESVLVAYSGGVDSVFLAHISHETLGGRAVAVTALSPSYPTYELEQTRSLAQRIGIRHILVETKEVENADYRANRGDRCYFCKTELYQICIKKAYELGLRWVINGVNCDDLRDVRPGLQAAQEWNVRSPLAEAGLTKKEIRELSRGMGLPTWDKQALACLSSRFPPGTEVTEERLRRVDRIETGLIRLGFKSFRVRFHEPVARIEVGPEDFGKFFDLSLRQQVSQLCHENGFLYAALDLDGYRMGSLNSLLSKA